VTSEPRAPEISVEEACRRAGCGKPNIYKAIGKKRFRSRAELDPATDTKRRWIDEATFEEWRRGLKRGKTLNDWVSRTARVGAHT
jgi:hypothetical protein